MPSKYYQGLYELRNTDKYKGDPTKIYYRSSWEFRFCKWADYSEKVIAWVSEDIEIPYKDRFGTQRTYYPDYYVEFLKEGKIHRWIVEVKPKKETVPPPKPTKMTPKRKKDYIAALETYMKNYKKWAAAVSYCNKRGMEFKIITEDVLDSKETGF